MLAPPKKNLICNFRAPNEQQYENWRSYVRWCQDHGRDVCYLTLSLADVFMKGVDGASGATIKEPNQTINLNMSNTFTYAVQRPRREPYDLSCVQPQYMKTFSSILFEAYVLHKASELKREFCFRDFLELKHDAFRRIVLRLVKKGKIIKNPQRSVPQFYFLPSMIEDYSPRPRTTE